MSSGELHEAWASGIFEWSPQRVGGAGRDAGMWDPTWNDSKSRSKATTAV